MFFSVIFESRLYQDFWFKYRPDWTIWSSKFQKLSGEGLTEPPPQTPPPLFLGLRPQISGASRPRFGLRPIRTPNFWTVAAPLLVAMSVTVSESMFVAEFVFVTVSVTMSVSVVVPVTSSVRVCPWPWPYIWTCRCPHVRSPWLCPCMTMSVSVSVSVCVSVFVPCSWL